MNIITLDFETFFDADYTLSKMSTEAYIRDPRFEVHGYAWWWPDGQKGNERPGWFHRGMQACTNQYTNEPLWIDDPIKYTLDSVPWDETALLCHHTAFDGLILSHHYGIVPKAYLDTLSMARLMLGNHVSVSLDSLREHFGMPLKRTPYQLFKGKHWSELDDYARQEITAGACDEVESIWTIFNKLLEGR